MRTIARNSIFIIGSRLISTESTGHQVTRSTGSWAKKLNLVQSGAARPGARSPLELNLLVAQGGLQGRHLHEMATDSILIFACLQNLSGSVNQVYRIYYITYI